MHDDMLGVTLDSLLCYVNRRFHIVREDLAIDDEERHARSQLIERFLWEHRDLIEDFVRENPDDLPEDHLAVARDLAGTVYGTLFLERMEDQSALIVHETGVYSVTLPHALFFSQMPQEPVELRGAIAPYRGAIVPIPPFAVLGRVTPSLLDHLHADLACQGTDTPTADARVLTQRSRAWRQRQERALLDRRLEHPDVNSLGQGYHRGVLAGLSEDARTRALQEHENRLIRESGSYQMRTEALYLETDSFPVSLEEALRLLDTDWICDIAIALGGTADQSQWSREEQIHWIDQRLAENHDDLDLALTWCLDEQFELLGMLMDTNPLPFDDLEASLACHLYPMVPYVFILREDAHVVAWMPPEVRALISRSRFEAAREARRRLGEVRSCARMLATMCGVCSLSEVYERYCQCVDNPFDRQHFEMALKELEVCEARDDYALWKHFGTDYVISVEIADESAPARVTRESYADHIMGSEATGLPENPIFVGLSTEDENDFRERVMRKERELEQMRLAVLNIDRTLPPHGLSRAMLQSTPVQALMRREPLRALRSFIDAHIPDGQDDYEFGDLLVRSVVVSAVLMAEGYNDTMDIIRLYHMEDCDGTGFSDTLGRLVTNAYNALPRWELNGWSLEENTERITGRKRFFNEDGTTKHVGENEPCPCGSGAPYGTCCGHLPVASVA